MKLFTSMFILLVSVSLGMANTIKVPGDAATIQAGIDSSVDGDTVLVAAGTYYENVSFNGTEIVLISEDGRENTIIDGSANGPTVLIANGESRETELNGFTIQNGKGVPSINIPNATFAGGVCVRYDSNPTIRNLIVRNNKTIGVESSGGGIGIASNSKPLVEDVIIQDNISYYGAGIYIYFAEPTLRNVTIHDNHATSAGGAGGFQSSKGNLSNVLIYDNTAVDYAGGLWFYDKSEVLLNQVTITGNSCMTYNGGGIWTLGDNTVYLVNSILWKNAPDQVASYVSAVYPAGSIGIDHSVVEGGSLGLSLSKGESLFYTQNEDSDPEFQDPVNKNFQLAQSSHCIDAGTAFFTWGSDTLLNMEPNQYKGEAPDVGALESATPLSNDRVRVKPDRMTLSANFPNPFNPSTRIAYTLNQAELISIDIYDVRGVFIRSLYSGWQIAGIHQLEWDGKDHLGRDLNSGVYLYQLRAENKILTRTMLLLR